VGHLVVPVPDDIADWIEDARHEEIGGAWIEEAAEKRGAGS
jgi:hypothetical protein